MTRKLVLRAAAIWLVIACLAVINGIVREGIVAPMFGEKFALPFSGISLSALVFVITYFTYTFLSTSKKSHCLYVGVQWVLMTLAFEVVFGHYVANKSWSEIAQVFNVVSGNLFSLVILTCLLSPYVVNKIRGGS